jgi:hypothetical protein
MRCCTDDSTYFVRDFGLVGKRTSMHSWLRGICWEKNIYFRRGSQTPPKTYRELELHVREELRL